MLLMGFFIDDPRDQNGITSIQQADALIWGNCNGVSNLLANKRINAITLDSSGVVLLAVDGRDPSQDAGLFHLSEDGWVASRSTRFGTETHAAYDFATFDNDVYAATGNGVWRKDGAEWEVAFLTDLECPGANQVLALDFDSGGNKWVGHNTGVSFFDNSIGEWVCLSADDEMLPSNHVRDITVQTSGQSREVVWIAMDGGGVTAFSDGERTDYTVADGLPGLEAQTLEVDPLNRIWVGMNDGAAFFDGTRWVQVSDAPVLSIAFSHDDSCSEVQCLQDSQVWLGTNKHGLLQSSLPYTDAGFAINRVCFGNANESASDSYVCPRGTSNEFGTVITYTHFLTHETNLSHSVYADIRITPFSGRTISASSDFLRYARTDETNLLESHVLIHPQESVRSRNPFSVNSENPRNGFSCFEG